MSLVEKLLCSLASAIEPAAAKKHAAARSQRYLRETLSSGQMESRILGDYLSGSYSRGTAIHPLDDVDIVFVIDPDTWSRSFLAKYPALGAVLSTFARAIRYRYPESYVRTQRRSIGLQLYHLDIDVVPAIETAADADIILIPDRTTDSWIKSSPKRHTAIAAAVNKKQGGHFKPLVKLLKYWNSQLPASCRLKSFAIETIAIRIFSTVPIKSIAGGLFDYFDFLASFSGQSSHRTWPNRFGIELGWWNILLPDVAGMNGNLLANIEKDHVMRFLDRAAKSRDRLLQAQTAATAVQVQKHFERVF